MTLFIIIVNQSINYYYQDVNLRSYLNSSIPILLTFGFLGRCIILHFPKRTKIHFFLPRRLKKFLKRRKRDKSRPGRWWAFVKTRPADGLKVRSQNRESDMERKFQFFSLRGLLKNAGKRDRKLIRLDREKQNEKRRIWPKKMQRRYGYRSKRRTDKSLREFSGAFKHPKYAGVDIAFLIENDDEVLPKHLMKRRSSVSNILPTLLNHMLPAVRPSLNYSVMQYLLNTKNKMHFDPVVVLNHFVAPGVEPSTMGGAKEDLRIRSRIAFFVESSTCEKNGIARNLAQNIHFIRFAGTTKTISSVLLSLFPFFGATFFFQNPRGNNEYAREQLLGQLRIKCWNLMGSIWDIQDPSWLLIEKFIDLGGIGEGIEIILRNRRIPYGYNSYLNEVQKMRSFTEMDNTLIESVKIKSFYLCASLIAQDISFQPRNNQISFRSIFSKIVKDIPLIMPKGVEGIRICCSGRLGGAEIARTECGKYGKTSRNVFNQKIDYAPAEVSTRYGISGVKVRISYSQNKKCPNCCHKIFLSPSSRMVSNNSPFSGISVRSALCVSEWMELINGDVPVCDAEKQITKSRMDSLWYFRNWHDPVVFDTGNLCYFGSFARFSLAH